VVFGYHFALFLYLAIIGPPGMQIEVIADSLHMRLLAPQIENEPETWTMKNFYNSLAYNVQYWKNGTDEKVSLTNRKNLRCGRLCSLLSFGTP
jgi:hypothetical protein